MKKNLLIWGTGLKGEETYKFLVNHKDYCVVAFGDNELQMQGMKKFGIKIISASDINKNLMLHGIVIASASSKDIRKQLEGIVKDIKIYESLDELIYTRISIDISGFCNGKCKWCVTGRGNRKSRPMVDHYMRISEFIKLYEYIYGIGLIGKKTEIMLYNWGEPLLNKDYIQIIEYLANQNQTFSVSTNASIIKLAKKENTYENCKSFIFSMPGFSQKSYECIHGFNFEQIKNNIKKLSENIKRSGFIGNGSISFHVYKFNDCELDEAAQFADTLGLKINPYYAYFNGNSLAETFLEHKMDDKTFHEAEKEIYLGHVEGLIKRRPEDYSCFLENILSLDYNANIVLCCAADSGLPDYKWKSVFEFDSVENVRKERADMLKCHSCRKCRALGIDYWMGNNPSYEMKESYV